MSPEDQREFPRMTGNRKVTVECENCGESFETLAKSRKGESVDRPLSYCSLKCHEDSRRPTVPIRITDHDAVKEVLENDVGRPCLRVRPYGNAALFGRLNRSNMVTTCNIATFDNGDLKVNIKEL